MGYLGEILTGHSMYVWTHRHTVTHHIYTNVTGIDPDIGIYKCSPNEPENGFKYRLREFIMPSYLQPYLYFFVVLQMQIDDFTSFNRKKMENTKINDTGRFQTLLFFGNKILYGLHRLFLPILFGQSIISTIFMFMTTEMIAGLLFGYFSQITHVQEEVLWPNKFEIEEDWAELQVKTAVDYCQESYFWTYISGNLNYQIIHHLFPSICQLYYPQIAPIVVQHCKQYNIPYKVLPNFWEAFKAHLNYLWVMGHVDLDF